MNKFNRWTFVYVLNGSAITYSIINTIQGDYIFSPILAISSILVCIWVNNGNETH